MSRMETDKRGRRVRRQFSDEFKAGAVRLVREEGKSISARANPDVAPIRIHPAILISHFSF